MSPLRPFFFRGKWLNHHSRLPGFNQADNKPVFCMLRANDNDAFDTDGADEVFGFLDNIRHDLVMRKRLPPFNPIAQIIEDGVSDARRGLASFIANEPCCERLCGVFVLRDYYIIGSFFQALLYRASKDVDALIHANPKYSQGIPPSPNLRLRRRCDFTEGRCAGMTVQDSNLAV